MAKKSAGILLYRRMNGNFEIFLVHPGGPFWAKKDEGAWSIPKGLYEDPEEPLNAAKREFAEETGLAIDGSFVELGSFKQPSGKTILAWALEFNCDPRNIKSNSFSLEWPPKSGRMQEFPEVDKADWFSPDDSLQKILKGQRPIIERLLDLKGIALAKAIQESAAKKPDRNKQGSLF